jgi:hypothetical protein
MLPSQHTDCHGYQALHAKQAQDTPAKQVPKVWLSGFPPDPCSSASLLPQTQGLSPKTAHKAATFRITRSSRRLQRSWRSFASQHKPTSQLAQEFAAQGVAALPQQQQEAEEAAAAAAQAEEPEVPPAGGFVMFGNVGSFKTSAKHEPFEDFAKKLQSPVTIKAAQARGPGLVHTSSWDVPVRCAHTLTCMLS